MIIINNRFAVGQTVYQHEAETDAVYRGVILGVQATSADASAYGSGNWTIIYEVQFNRSSDWVAEELLSSRVEFPELVAPEPTHEPGPASVGEALTAQGKKGCSNCANVGNGIIRPPCNTCDGTLSNWTAPTPV